MDYIIALDQGTTSSRSIVFNHAGEIVAELDRAQEGVAIAAVDMNEVDRARAAWGFFRDRRTDLYAPLVDPLPDQG